MARAPAFTAMRHRGNLPGQDILIDQDERALRHYDILSGVLTCR
jgi:hypothetical protein